MQPIIARPGEVVDIFSTWRDAEVNSVVIRTERMEVSRLHVAAGRRIPTYEAQGEVVILCVEGRVAVEALGRIHELQSGQLLDLLLNEPFGLQAHDESSLLITIVPASINAPLKGIGSATP